MVLALLCQIPLVTVPGDVCDLSPDPTGPPGSGTYVTRQGEVGRFDVGGSLTTTLTVGSLPNELRAAYPTPAGDLLVLDQFGDLYRLPGANGPASLLYDNLFIIQFPTDLVVDSAGVALISCRTISAGTYAIAHVSPDGQDWAYLHVANLPVALAPDGDGLDYVVSDGFGFLQTFDELNEAPRTTELAAATGFSASSLDGDVVVEADGDVWFVAGSELRFHDRTTGTTTTQVFAPGPLRGVTILSVGAGHRVVYAGGNGTNTIWLGPNCDPPAPTFAQSFGPVPDRGTQRAFSGLNVFDMTTDRDGHLLLAGDVWGSNQSVRRVTIPDFVTTVVAGPAEGIQGKLEGVAVTPDGLIRTVSSAGVVQTVEETNFGVTVTTDFADPSDQIVRAKDLALGRQGQVYVADWRGFQLGAVQRIDANGTLNSLTFPIETRGTAPNPFTGELLYTEWIASGFAGFVRSLNEFTGLVTNLPGMTELNMSNGGVWADGDLLVDAAGDVYVTCEDEFSVLRHDREHGVKIRVACGYLNRPSGVALAPAAVAANSTTGWSLYVAERNAVWEIENALPPGPNLLDPGAPPAGELLGWARPEHGSPTDVVRDPLGADILAVTDAGYLLRLPLSTATPASVLRGPADGLPLDLTALSTTVSGRLTAVSRGGVVVSIDPSNGYAVSTQFTDPNQLLNDVTDVVSEPSGDLLLLEADPTPFEGGRIWRLAGAALSPVSDTHHGQRAVLDPTSGEAWVLQRGRSGEGGEILRIDLGSQPAVAGHLRTSPFRTFFGRPGAGDLALNAEGDAFVVEGATGRIWRIDRATGMTTPVGGHYVLPQGAAVSFGRAGIAGSGGSSLFVIDGAAVYEHGIDGTVPPAAPGQLNLPPADLTAPARRVFPGLNEVRIEEPGSAFRTYAILAGFSGKLPGLPLDEVQTLPLNFDPLFQFGGTALLPGFFGVLDDTGSSAPGVGVQLPPNLPIATTGVFMDLAWVALDLTVPSLIGFRGSTAQVYLGP